MPGLSGALQQLLDAIYPPRCVVCGRAGDVVCARCLNSMRPPEAPICDHCGTTIPAAPHPAPQLCPECVAGRRLSLLDGVRVATTYTGAARTALLAFKFAREQRVAGRLATLLTAPFQCDIHMADMVIPVPLHRSRQRERGYNQAELLAGAFARLQGLSLRTDILARTRATEAQTHLTGMERRRNVAGAFALRASALAATVRGKRILLIDDVTTTGSTLNAAAEPLRAAGATSVWGLAFASPAPGMSDTNDAV
ncbi:MAG: ComF family protein [Nitrososphaerota archaeon]